MISNFFYTNSSTTTSLYNGLEDEYKKYEILINIILGDKTEYLGVGVSKNKKSYLMKDNSIYKVKLEDVGAEGFEPPTPWV